MRQIKGQISITEYLGTLEAAVCNHSGHTWNGSEEPERVYVLDIRGICDDPYCPHCGYEFETTRTCKNYEVDCERCPECHVKVDWRRWHRANDEP